MSDNDIDQLPAGDVADICERFKLSDDAKPLVRQGLTPAGFLAELVAKELYGDAIRYIAYSLSKRQAVWWGCLCAWDTGRPELAKPEETAALEAAVQWVLQPTEETRRAAEAGARAAKLGSPAGCVAMAAFWSNGSMSKPGLPDVPPDPDFTARTVAAGLILASKQQGKIKTPEFSRQFLALGIEVAMGRNRWAPEQA